MMMIVVLYGNLEHPGDSWADFLVDYEVLGPMQKCRFHIHNLLCMRFQGQPTSAQFCFISIKLQLRFQLIDEGQVPLLNSGMLNVA